MLGIWRQRTDLILHVRIGVSGAAGTRELGRGLRAREQTQCLPPRRPLSRLDRTPDFAGRPMKTPSALLMSAIAVLLVTAAGAQNALRSIDYPFEGGFTQLTGAPQHDAPAVPLGDGFLWIVSIG